jgi:hypothetical protein
MSPPSLYFLSQLNSSSSNDQPLAPPFQSLEQPTIFSKISLSSPSLDVAGTCLHLLLSAVNAGSVFHSQIHFGTISKPLSTHPLRASSDFPFRSEIPTDD